MPRSLYRTTPLLVGKTLHLPAESPDLQATNIVQVGSPEWLQWLTTASRFACRLQVHEGRTYTITFRVETKQRGGSYWSAYMKDQSGKLHKLYVSRLTEITWEQISRILELMRTKLTHGDEQELSYPTQAGIADKAAQVKRPLSILTAEDVAQFRQYATLLSFCSREFEQRWGRAWRWQNGKIYRNTFDKYYYVMDESGEQRHILGKQRYFIVVQLLHWVNYGYDEGFNDKLPNT